MKEDIQKIILGALGYLYEYRIVYSKAFIVHFILIVIINFAIPESASGLIFVIAIICSAFVYTLVAIITHRSILIGPSSFPMWGIYMPTGRELSFLFHGIGIGFICILIVLLTYFIPFVGPFLTYIAVAYVVGRLSLVFPAIATDNQWTFSDSWSATGNYQIVMLIVVIILPVIVSIPEYLISYIPYTALIVTIIQFLTLIFTIAALSVAFKVISEDIYGTSN